MAELLLDRRTGGIWNVRDLVGAVSALLDQGFAACSVSGEIAGLSRAASGHVYFTLKDPGGAAALRCAMFRRAASMLAFTPSEGQRVDVRGRLSVYEPRGELQFIAEAMQAAGAGALYERFLRLRARLEAEGLFDAGVKRPLPAHPATIGVVTSLGGAALHDVATTLARRSPHVGVIVYPSVVQGNDAPAALCAAIAAASARREVDVLIVCRGGGSLEDLWAFNDERVVRALRAASMPVVSGVGHETDVTLADLAADVRAPTPTAAAELVAPATAPQRGELERSELALVRRVGAQLETHAQRIDRLALQLARPSEGLARRSHAIDLLEQRLRTAPREALAFGRSGADSAAARIRHALVIAQTRASGRIDAVEGRLRTLDPQRVLARGYALLVGAGGEQIASVEQLAIGTVVSAHLADGRAMLTTASVARAAGNR